MKKKRSLFGLIIDFILVFVTGGYGLFGFLFDICGIVNLICSRKN